MFGDKYNVASLRTLTLYKIHKILKNFKVYGKLIEDIFGLVQYSYNNENNRDNQMDMRWTVWGSWLHYVACIFELVAGDNSFLALIEEGGPFVRDPMSML
jgi:hypothetical protein